MNEWSNDWWNELKKLINKLNQYYKYYESKYI